MNRKQFVTSSAMAAAVATLSRLGAKAQEASQAVGNGLQIVSTGNVVTRQAAGGDQSVFGSGGYQVSAGQTVSNNGQIVSTGDVYATQDAAGQQAVYASGSACIVGSVFTDGSRLYYYDNQCTICEFVIPCCQPKCKSGNCR